MRAVQIDQVKTPGAVHTVPVPEPGVGEILVRVTVAGVNPIDWKIRDGEGGNMPKLPLTLGQDFAGVVERLGTGVTGYTHGDRIFGVARTHGSYAEYTVVKADSQPEPIAPTGGAITDEQAASLPTPALTAYAALEKLGVGKDTKVVIQGATGAVGGFAVQMAHARGAHVIATVKGDTASADQLGADEVIDVDEADLIQALRGTHPEGVDAILDTVSDADALKRLASTIRGGGRLVTTIHDADERFFNEHGIEATNLTMSETPQSSRAGLETMVRMVVDGTITPRITARAPLADAANLLEQSKAGKVGVKAVVDVSEA
jgi:NADPH:quinone reductase-like Zn-dependent oxidoreductase